MIKVQDIVSEIVKRDDVAGLAIQNGYINFSKYARKIKPEVDKTLLMDISEKTIVVSLIRLAKLLDQKAINQNKVKLDHISVHPDLGELCYERNSHNLKLLKIIQTDLQEKDGLFFTTTESVGEITIIANNRLIKKVVNVFNKIDPIYSHNQLTGITVKFSKAYLDIPNVIYDITKELAIKDLNIIEIVSTTTELTYIIERHNTELALRQLSKLV